MLVGTASKNEKGTYTGGQAGDQSLVEVYTREYYNGGWNIMLRAKDPNKAEIMAKSCEAACNNPAVGYDKNTRNSLRTEAQKVNFDLSKVGLCNCDCSSFMSVCAESANIPIPYNYNNAPTTSTMRKDFLSTGEFDLYTDSIYLTSPNFLKRGDILVKEGSHTLMALENGSLANNQSTATTTMKGIDISQYNAVTDYNKLASQINYVIIRVGYRGYGNGTLTEDFMFKKHIDNCIKNGIQNLGIYFYDQSLNENEAIEQAIWVSEKIKSYKDKINMPVYIDSEYSNTAHNGRADKISKQQRTKNVIAFCNKIAELGYTAGVYASNSWFTSMLEFDKLKNYNIWCARYSTQKPTISKYDIWQYGSEQFIWSNKPVDVNYIYKLSSNVQTGLNEPNKPLKKGITINNKVNASSLNVRKFPDILSSILYKLNRNDKIEIFGYAPSWYSISDAMTEWVNSDYILTAKGKVTATKLNYRQNVGTNSKLLGQFNKNEIVKILRSQQNGDTIWYLCLGKNDKFGWASGDYIVSA